MSLPRVLFSITALLLIAVAQFSCTPPYLGVYDAKIDHPQVDILPDEKTAIDVAIVILKRIYGDKEIEAQKPFKATLERGVWIIEGFFDDRGGTRVGGSAYIGLRKRMGVLFFGTMPCNAPNHSFNPGRSAASDPAVTGWAG